VERQWVRGHKRSGRRVFIREYSQCFRGEIRLRTPKVYALFWSRERPSNGDLLPFVELTTGPKEVWQILWQAAEYRQWNSLGPHLLPFLR